MTKSEPPAIRIEIPAAQAGMFEEDRFFEGMGDVPFSSTLGADGRLLVWVDSADAPEALARLDAIGVRGLSTFEEIPRDWVAESAALRKSVLVERYLLDPHNDDLATEPPPGVRRLFLSAARAFGTGSHESTRLALRLLLLEDLKRRWVLDAGCGAGTLAFVAALEGASRVVALDIDVDAAFAAREHAAANGIRGVGVFAGPLQALRGSPTFDVIVANMLQEELAPLLPALRNRLRQGGRLVAAGQLVEREGEWETLLRRHGLEIVRSLRENEWLGTASVRAG